MGPDAMALQSNQRLQIFKAGGGLRHLRILDEEGNIEAAMSGEVILNPDLILAKQLDVEVVNVDLQPCGMFSWRYLLFAVMLVLPCHTLRWIASTLYEKDAQPGPGILRKSDDAT